MATTRLALIVVIILLHLQNQVKPQINETTSAAWFLDIDEVKDAAKDVQKLVKRLLKCKKKLAGKACPKAAQSSAGAGAGALVAGAAAGGLITWATMRRRRVAPLTCELHAQPIEELLCPECPRRCGNNHAPQRIEELLCPECPRRCRNNHAPQPIRELLCPECPKICQNNHAQPIEELLCPECPRRCRNNHEAEQAQLSCPNCPQQQIDVRVNPCQECHGAMPNNIPREGYTLNDDNEPHHAYTITHYGGIWHAHRTRRLQGCHICLADMPHTANGIPQHAFAHRIGDGHANFFIAYDNHQWHVHRNI